MTLHGRNTPRSVLVYIDAVQRAREPAIDPFALARDLGYGPKGFRRLKEKHGDGIVAYLVDVKRRRTERPRFLARQNGLVNPPEYVEAAQGAIDDAEAVGDEYLAKFRKEADVKEADHRARLEARARAERLRQAELELRAAGKSPAQYAKAVDDAIEAMRKAARS